ncbi:hypothetical protein ACHAXS_009871 [Conticribra weissflogii]
MTQTPNLPPLYFKHRGASVDSTRGPARDPSLESLPPELLHRCLAQYSDWGDLAKLACVRSSWKNLVRDAAEFGGRDAMWELSMCLLHGHDGTEEDSGDSAEESREGRISTSENETSATRQPLAATQTARRDNDNDNDNDNRRSRNNRGLQKNEPLAVRYLTQLSGIQIDPSRLHRETCTEKDRPAVFPHDFHKHKLPSLTRDYSPDEASLVQLSRCHLHGIGVPSPDASLAIHYLEAAFHLARSTESAHSLALLYEYPRHSNHLVPTEIYAAFEWFRAAAEGGHVPSMAELALCYELGCGVVQSDESSLDWYMKAAQAGHGGAHFAVGEAYEEARGVPLDEEEACLWYYRAAVLGEEDGKRALRRLRDVAVRVLPEAGLEAAGILHV